MNCRLHTIFCDDIRREDNGKLIIIGVYGDDMVLHSFPTKVRLSFWVRLEGLPADKQEVEISISVNGKSQHTINANVEAEPTKRLAQFFLQGAPVQFDEPGELTLAVQLHESEPLSSSIEVLRRDKTADAGRGKE